MIFHHEIHTNFPRKLQSCLYYKFPVKGPFVTLMFMKKVVKNVHNAIKYSIGENSDQSDKRKDVLDRYRGQKTRHSLQT